MSENPTPLKPGTPVAFRPGSRPHAEGLRAAIVVSADCTYRALMGRAAQVLRPEAGAAEQGLDQLFRELLRLAPPERLDALAAVVWCPPDGVFLAVDPEDLEPPGGPGRQVAAVQPAPAPPEPPKAHILVVDDQPANVLALQAVLAPLGQEMIVAHSGDEALRLLLRHDFAVVLLDVLLGAGPSGLEIARLMRTRKRTQHTPVLFVTAYEPDPDVVKEAYRLGAVDFLVKPVVPEILLAKVEVFVRLFQQAARLRALEARRAADEAVRASERRFRALVEHAWDGISLLAPDGTVLENIPDNLSNLGYTPEEFVGHSGLEFMHPEDQPAVRAALAQLLQTPGGRATAQYRLRHKDGSWRWVEAVGTNLLDDPSVRAVVVNYRDVTEHKLAEQERERLLAELRRLNEAKDEFISVLAHELRNPLAPLLTGLHILRQPQITPEAREQTRAMMVRQLGQMTHLVDDLLDVSRIGRGKVQLRTERLDLARLVRTAAEDRRPTLEQAGLRLALDVPATPVWVTGDPTRLVQIVNNLLENAVKFSDGGREVAVRVAADAGAGQALLSVRDQGIGIEPDVLPRLFQIFAQGEHGPERSRGGLGLGLALVKGLAELHGGRAEAFSEGPGRGAEFTVRLPLEREPQALTEPPSGAHAAGKRLRVLVVEDNKDAADSMALFLGMLGHEVRLAATGPEGVEAARAWRPDVVLCDIGLPGLDGYGVARELRLHPTTARVRLLALTGYGTEEDRRRSREAGFDHHLVKPADPDELQRLLASG